MKSKLVLIVFVLLAGSASYLLYEDSQNEQLVYEFCSRFSTGNSVAEFETAAVEFGMQKIATDKDTQIMFTLETSLPFLESHVCVAETQANRISRLSVTTHSM